MKNIFIFVCLVCCLLGNSQSFTSEELKLIKADGANVALTIFQTNDAHQHSVLLKKSTAINPLDKDLPLLIDKMKLALAGTGGGVGIAGPQVGINRNVILVQRFDKENHPVEYFINPKIIWQSNVLILGPEGDLSISDFRDNFYRSQSIQLEYYNLKAEKITEIVEGFTAVIFQHEIDHLFGVLISDKIMEQEKQEFLKVDAYQKSK